MDIRIYVMTHRRFEVWPDPMYVPLHVGRACARDLGLPGDDTGENISERNCYYSELTGFYWLWKNGPALDYIGTCHYRRYLIDDQEKIFTRAAYARLLQDYDVITTKRVKLNNSYYDGFCANHNRKALDMTGTVIKERHPQYYEAFLSLVNGTETYFGNILVTSRPLFDAYCEWLFDIFFAVADRIELETGEDAYHKRVFGFISEFLLLVWVTVKQLKVLECKVGMLGEKAETKEMKERLAEYFFRRDVNGAKDYFLRRREERPDVLMEASDVTGELRLSMQIIATAGMERQAYGQSILERENRFRELIRLFDRMNRTIYHYRNGMQTAEDAAFLKNAGISETAVRIAVGMGRDDGQKKKEVLEKILKDMGCHY